MTQQVQVLTITTPPTTSGNRVEVTLWRSFHYLVSEHLHRFSSLAKASAACHDATGVVISVNTLSRVSRGYEPDLFTFGVLWQWMGVRIEGVRVVEVEVISEQQ